MAKEEFECGHCGFTCCSREELYKHMNKSHAASWLELGAGLAGLVGFFVVLIYLAIVS